MRRGILLFGWISLFGFLATSAWGCEKCQFPSIFSADSFCKPVLDGEVGVTECVDTFDPFGGSANSHGQWTCTETGRACSIITVGGGPGGGTGGGGGGLGCRPNPSGCPAECFSCDDRHQ